MGERRRVKILTVFYLFHNNVGVNAGTRRWRGRIWTTVIYLTKMLDKYRVSNASNSTTLLKLSILWGYFVNVTVIFTCKSYVYNWRFIPSGLQCWEIENFLPNQIEDCEYIFAAIAMFACYGKELFTVDYFRNKCHICKENYLVACKYLQNVLFCRQFW